MKQIFFLILFCALSTNLFSQSDPFEKRNCATIGILQGGGSLIGADLEFFITPQFSFQLGAGYVGFGGGLNYHFLPTFRSSFISLQYWNQGIGESFAQSAIGPSFVFRGKRWFTFQLGVGAPLDRGPALPADFEQPPLMLLYSIGAYFPI